MEENRTDTPQVTEAQQNVNAFDTEALSQFGATEGSDDNKKPLHKSRFRKFRKHSNRMPRTMNVVTNIGNHKQQRERMSYKH